VKFMFVTVLAFLGLGQCIRAEAQSTVGTMSAPVAGRVFQTVVRTQDVEELRYYVLKGLTDRFAQANRIKVTPAETDAYARQVREALGRDRRQREAQRQDLQRQLASPGLSESERAALVARIDVEDKVLAALPAPGQDTPQERAAREQIARAFILQWKINRALYRKFGGRIVFQQGGPEPLDAYRRFLEQQQALGNFEVRNEAMREPFWSYYLDDRKHSFYPKGSFEEAQAFVTPPWQRRQ
jgi:hypothetical protein